jgi:nitrite reductase/ring-hydroxylating ferredoxin subunit
VAREYAVCPAASIPDGSHIVLRAGSRELGVFNLGGEYFALPNACPHQSGPLCRGKVTGTVTADEASGWAPHWIKEGEIIVCPWHSREFDIRSGVCLADSGQHVPVYRARVSDGQVLVTLPR